MSRFHPDTWPVQSQRPASNSRGAGDEQRAATCAEALPSLPLCMLPYTLSDVAHTVGVVMRTVLTIAVGLVSTLLPSLSLAHDGGGPTGWLAGIVHPLHGWDHLLVAVSIGFWAAHHRKTATWLIVFTFGISLACGFVAGHVGFKIPFVEAAIMVSVVALSVLALSRRVLPTAASALGVMLFGFCHGLDHAIGTPATAGAWTFGIGLIIMTMALQAAGWGFKSLLTRRTISSRRATQ